MFESLPTPLLFLIGIVAAFLVEFPTRYLIRSEKFFRSGMQTILMICAWSLLVSLPAWFVAALVVVGLAEMVFGLWRQQRAAAA